MYDVVEVYVGIIATIDEKSITKGKTHTTARKGPIVVLFDIFCGRISFPRPFVRSYVRVTIFNHDSDVRRGTYIL